MTKCQYCNSEILWAVTAKGHRIPLDPSPTDNGNVTLEFRPGDSPIATVLGQPEKASGPVWIAHFATCVKFKRRSAKGRRPNPNIERHTTLRLKFRIREEEPKNDA